MTDFGAMLREARERRGLSLRQIAASTKISVAVLESLERNDISRLPGGLFSRAFVRSYAAEVGLDPDATVRAFAEAFDVDGPVPEHGTAADANDGAARGLRVRAAWAALAAAAIALIVAGVYVALRPGDGSGTDVRPPAADAAPRAAPTPALLRTPPPSGTQPVPAPVPAAIEDGPVLRLDLHPTAACWVSMIVDGEHLRPRVMQPGEHETRTVRREAVIEVGDAAAFAWTINDRPGRALGGPGEVKRVRITPATAARYIR